MTFSIDSEPPLGKYVWDKPSGEQGLKHCSVVAVNCALISGFPSFLTSAFFDLGLILFLDSFTHNIFATSRIESVSQSAPGKV